MYNVVILDYDGDQVTVKGVYTIEANKEVGDYMKSKSFYIDASGMNVRVSQSEAIQSIYSLTRVYDESLLTNPF